MYIAMAKIKVKKDGRDLFERIMNKSVDLTKKAKGVIDFKILRPREEDAAYVIYAAWETKDDLEAFNHSEDAVLFQNEAKVLAEYFEGKSTFEEYDTI